METETSKPAPDTEPTAAPADVAKARRPARTKAAKPAAEKKAAKLPGKAAPAQAALKAAPAKRPARKKPAAPAPEAKAAAPTAARKAARAETPQKHHEETTRHDPKTVIESILSLGTSLLRVNRGVVVQGHRAKSAKLLELYEAEYCPFCRHVREALTELDLDAHIYPMPKGGKRYRDQLVKLGGKAKVPFLHDPNTGTKLYESEAIADYQKMTQTLRQAGIRPRFGLLHRSILLASAHPTSWSASRVRSQSRMVAGLAIDAEAVLLCLDRRRARRGRAVHRHPEPVLLWQP